jgi:RNA polymerase sigma-70 factor (ECF subfamily)
MPRALPSDRLPARLNRLHQANLRGEPTATAEIFSLAFERLRTHLKIAVPGADSDHVSDACTDAILAYLRRPNAFDPAKSSLWTFLCVIAARRLSDLRRSAGRRQHGEDSMRRFELLVPPSNNLTGEDRHFAREIEANYLSEIAHDERELRVLELLCCDVRETEPYAAVLGLDNSDPGMAREVKRVKDKLKARLKKVRNALEGAV